MATTKKEPPSNKEVCLLFLQNKTTGNFEFTNSSGGKCFSKGQSGICPGCKTVLVYRKNRDLWIPMDVAYAFDAQQRESGEIRERKLAEESKNIECGL
jgi:hypothetical protein